MPKTQGNNVQEIKRNKDKKDAQKKQALKLQVTDDFTVKSRPLFT